MQDSQNKLQHSPSMSEMGKTPLWKQIQHAKGENRYSRKCSDYDSQSKLKKEEQSQPRKRKQKCPTISNFLKTLQVQMQQNSSKCDLDSQILSIVDVKYPESFCSHRDKNNSKSFIEDWKFHIFLQTVTLKDEYKAMKDTLHFFIKTFTKQQQSIIENVKKLVKSYETELANKNMEYNNIYLQIREQRVKSIQQKYTLEREYRQKQELFKNLQQKFEEANLKLRSERQQCRQLKAYNKQINQMLLKSHKKAEQLELRIETIRRQSQKKLKSEVEQVEKKYIKILQEEKERYEFNINYLKEKQASNTNLNNDLTKISDVSIDIGNSFALRSQEGQKTSRKSDDNQIASVYQTFNINNTNDRNNINQKKQNRMISSLPSPNSSCSSRRFRRTTKLGLEGEEKNQNSINKEARMTYIPKIRSLQQEQTIKKQKDLKNLQKIKSQTQAVTLYFNESEKKSISQKVSSELLPQKRKLRQTFCKTEYEEFETPINKVISRIVGGSNSITNPSFYQNFNTKSSPIFVNNIQFSSDRDQKYRKTEVVTNANQPDVNYSKYSRNAAVIRNTRQQGNQTNHFFQCRDKQKQKKVGQK